MSVEQQPNVLLLCCLSLMGLRTSAFNHLPPARSPCLLQGVSAARRFVCAPALSSSGSKGEHVNVNVPFTRKSNGPKPHIEECREIIAALPLTAREQASIVAAVAQQRTRYAGRRERARMRMRISLSAQKERKSESKKESARTQARVPCLGVIFYEFDAGSSTPMIIDTEDNNKMPATWARVDGARCLLAPVYLL
jgi:hypothetical protein